MPANLVHIVIDALKPAAVDRIAAGLGEPPAATRKALTTALPVALLGLVGRSADPRGADSIRDAIHHNRLSAETLDHLAIRPQLNAGTFLAGGQGAAERLIEGPVERNAERLALYADVRRSSAHALQALCVPLLLAALVRGYPYPLDTAAVQRALAEQAPLAHRSVPPGFGPAHTPATPAARPPEKADHEGAAGWVTLATALGVLALLLFGVGYWNAGRDRPVAQDPGSVTGSLEAPPRLEGGSSTQRAEVILPPASAAFADELERYLVSDDPAPRNFRFEGLHFARGSDELHADSTQTLDRIAAILRERPEVQVEVEGHTDARGGRRSNERLSEQRAAIVAEALIERGVDPSRVTSIGHGESRPIADNDTEEGRMENRRTELAIVSKGRRG